MAPDIFTENGDARMAEIQRTDLTTVKKVLTSFALGRMQDSTVQLEAEFGDLLLFMINLADKQGIDLLRAGQRQVERRAKTLPRAVRGS
jgi:response regulator of citrate/malate metabolism